MEGSASQAGFYYQNNVAALKIIDCLFFNSDIAYIQLENYNRGPHIDDIIIYRETTTDYFQIKWSNDDEKVYSLYNLITSEEGKKSLFAQLAEGYQKAIKQNTDFTIFIFTTKREGAQKRPSKGIKHSLPQIRRNVFEPLKASAIRYDSLPDYSEYEETIEILRKESSLDKDAFNDFIKKLEFCFSQEPTEQIQSEIRFKFDKLGIETNLVEKLLDGVVKWSITGEKVTRDTVLNCIEISSRFEDKLSHYFKVVDDKYYVPNKSLISKLETALNELGGGYIFIEGLPGIGKSTALTKFKESTPEITLAYYCFIPDATNNFGEIRHKSDYFLKSLCISIEKQFPDIDLPNKYSERYEEKLISYIDKLSTIKKKVVFIIDGLDHVHRDTSVGENSLLNQIKGSLPPGIYFILSSQYGAVLSQSVNVQINSDPRRHIIVPRFKQPEIKEYLSNKGIKVNQYLDKIESTSSGIPLYLHYISEILLKTETRNYEDVLNALPNLNDGKINSYHEYLFQKVKDDEFVKWVLAIFAFRKEDSTPETIHEILCLAGENRPLSDVIKVIQDFSHLHKQKDGKSFSIFHNSFREFIISKTSGLKDRFNQALVLFYEKNPNTDEAHRNYFTHLYEIGNYKKITEAVTLTWLKSAWHNYRTIEETRANLKIALSATIETTSLSEFIRISFIKAQFERLAWNLENSDIDFPILLLKVGETANSLRSIWDGDFVLTNKVYFSFYLIQYYKKHNTLLPNNIKQQGLSKDLESGKTNQLETIFKAKALVYPNAIDVFNEIDELRWVSSDEHRTDYHRKIHSDQKNYKINFKLKVKVIEFLFECNKFKELLSLTSHLGQDKKLLNYVYFSLVKLLLPIEEKAAIEYIKKLDFEIISNKKQLKFISYCSDYLSFYEIKETFTPTEMSLPTLHEDVIQMEGMNYQIHKDILELFSYLKVIWIYKPEQIDTLFLRISSLPVVSKHLYNSVLSLSELWNKCRHEKINEFEKLDLLKKALKELYVPRERDSRRTNRGLFDMDTNSSFIARSIKHLYANIFNYAIKVLLVSDLIKLVDFWFELESGDNGYRNYSAALSIAQELNSIKDNSIIKQKYKLIKYSEDLARTEEETATLVEYIGEIAEAYGICGFEEDFKRNYNQIIELAFGVGHRKDYQTSYIVSPLEQFHNIDPENTLKRLAEVIHIQDLLADAGNGRMHHICLSDLISFTMTRFPELAFKIFENEEKHLGREEAMNRIISPLIKQTTSEELMLLFSITKTLPSWSLSGAWDNHFLILATKMMSRAIQLKDPTLINEILYAVRQYALVEVEKPEILEDFSNICINEGVDFKTYNLPTPQKEEEVDKKEKRKSKDERFSIKHSSLSNQELVDLFDRDYSKFKEHVQNQFEVCLSNRRNSTLRNEYHRSKATFEKFLDTLPDEENQVKRNEIDKVIRAFVEFKQKVVRFTPTFILKASELENIFHEFIDQIATLFPEGTVANFIDHQFEMDKWTENILKFVNDHRGYVFSQVIDEDGLLKLAKETSIVNYENIIDFLENNPIEKSKSAAYLIVASRILSIDPQKAKEILVKVAENGDENIIFPQEDERKHDNIDLAESILNIDSEFGKKFLLKSYINQRSYYTDTIITSFDKLLRYKRFFDDELAVKAYYDSNLQYNKELAKGLPGRENRFDFIQHHKEELSLIDATLKHLIWLLDYPVIKVREMTLKSIYRLLTINDAFLTKIIHFGIINGSDNQIEHCLVILKALSITHPHNLKPYKKELLKLTTKKHFHILESLKELLLSVRKHDEGFLTTSENEILNNLNKQSPIITENNIINFKEGKNFVYSEYQGKLLYEFYQNEYDDSEFDQDVYNILVTSGWKDYDAYKDSNIHKNYNINTNYDTIEIQTPYCKDSQSIINTVFHSKIRRGCFEESFAEKAKYKLRLYDPSKLIYQINHKPDYINWIPLDIPDEDFIQFNDLNDFKSTFIKRELEYITLAEYGNQRISKSFDDGLKTCYFEVYAFLKNKEFDDSILDSYYYEGISPKIYDENLYVYNLPRKEYNSSSFPINGIKPLVQVSHNNFRGESDLKFACLLYDIYDELNIERRDLLKILTNNESDYPLKAERWQNAYTSTGRRRYKPISEGFNLKIEKNILIEYIKKNDLELCYEIKIERSCSRGTPESLMEWHNLNERINVKVI